VDRDRYSAIAHGDMRIWNPIPLEALLRLTDQCLLNAASRVLDVGCGRAELLLQLIERHQCLAVGVDPSPRATALALAEADERDGEAHLHLQVAAFDSKLFAPSSFDLVCCLGSTHACGSFADCLVTLKRLVRPGGFLLVGEGYWRQPPAQAYLDLLGCTKEELHGLEEFEAMGTAQGLVLAAQELASGEDWRVYETTYAANMQAFLKDHPQDDEAAPFRQRLEAWTEGVARWGQSTLGFAACLFQKPLEDPLAEQG